ncbi:MAG: hypothetical protein ABH803_01290 [Candidatus Micrarchaeota archaeon]
MDSESFVLLVVILVLAMYFGSGDSITTNELFVLPALIIAIPIALFQAIVAINLLAGFAALFLLYFLAKSNFYSPLFALAIFAFVILSLL